MYTRCPRCHTIFSLTEEQRAARGGLVRCGRCSAVFQSNDGLLQDLLQEDEAQHGDSTGAPSSHAATAEAAGDAAIGVAEHLPAEASSEARAPEFPLLRRSRRTRTRTPFWILGNLLLVLLLGAQALYFYGASLSNWYPPVSQVVAGARRWFGLRTAARTDIGLIDLQQAQIAPHPSVANALRITATLVNRALRVQPYPLLEVTFSGSGGSVIARRVFRPREYLGAAQSRAGMPPNVAIPVSFDVLNPGQRAVGYEIQLFAGRQ
ncbi:MAG: DUF3426 domain-containing protein [Acidiferrobacterales bacterium]